MYRVPIQLGTIRGGGRPGCVTPEQPSVDQPGGEPAARRTLDGVWSQRSVVDYGLARRAALTALLGDRLRPARDGRLRRPPLPAAGGPLPRRADGPRPARCAGPRAWSHVSYVYGDELGQYSGRVKSHAELEEMAHEHGEFRVYVVEVCAGCGWKHLARPTASVTAWNQLVQSYAAADGVPRRRRAAEPASGRPASRRDAGSLRWPPLPTRRGPTALDTPAPDERRIP